MLFLAQTPDQRPRFTPPDSRARARRRVSTARHAEDGPGLAGKPDVAGESYRLPGIQGSFGDGGNNQPLLLKDDHKGRNAFGLVGKGI